MLGFTGSTLPTTTSTTSSGSGGSFWGDISDRFFKYLDYSIDDAFGMLDNAQEDSGGDVWGNWQPEQTPPANDPPTEPGFVIGNNPQTWGAGLVLLGAAYLVYRAVK
jgi:hypothetical protein